MIKKTLLILFSLLLIFSCSNKKKERNISVKKTWYIPGASVRVPENSSGIYKDKIYIARFKNTNTITLHFYDFEGNKTKTVDFNRGKGPAQINNPALFSVAKDKIYIYDDTVQKLNLYDLKGNFIKAYSIDTKLGLMGSCKLDDKYLYYHGFYKNKLVKYNYKKRKIVEKISYKNFNKKDFKDKKFEVNGGYMHIIKDKIYIGYYNQPYRIEIYNKNLKHLETIKKELDKNYQDVVKTEKGVWTGAFVISSVKSYDNNLYASFGGGDKSIGKNSKLLKNRFRIFVFDKKHKYKFKLINNKLKYIQGNIWILGIKNNKIIMLATDRNDFLKNISIDKKANIKSSLKNKYDIQSKTAVLIFSK